MVVHDTQARGLDKKTMFIGKREIGPNAQPFIVAEMSGNHDHSLERALAIVDAAAEAGAHAVKLQTYTADTMTLDMDQREFMITDPGSPWAGQSLYSLYEKAHTPRKWHAPIMERAKSAGLLCFSSPFDDSAVDFLESLDVPCYKIASFECVDLPLIQKAARTKKPLIISTGAASIAEIGECVETARSAGCKDIILLKCTSTYPASPDHSNLRTIPHMRELFGCEVGLSDHTPSIGTALAAVALGAVMIEKHFTLSRNGGGVDACFSLEPDEFAALATESIRARQALGKISYGPTPAEQNAVKKRRSLYIIQDVEKGDVLTPKNLGRIRPGHGLKPKYYDILLGKKANRAVKKGTPVTWDVIVSP